MPLTAGDRVGAVDPRATLAIDFDGVIGRPLLGLNVRIGAGEWPSSILTKPIAAPWPMLESAKSVLARLRYSGRKPMEDAGQGLERLAKRWRLVVVTARPASMQKPTLDWLQRHNLLTFISDLRTNDTGLPTPLYKLQAARDTSAVGFIEDDGRTARYLSSGGVGLVFLVDWPKNRGEYPSNVKVVRNLSEVSTVLEDIYPL